MHNVLAALLSALAITLLACTAPAEDPTQEISGQETPVQEAPAPVYIVAKDKASGEVIDESLDSDVRKSGSCKDLAEESAALNPILEFHCEARRQAGATDSAVAENTRASTEQSYLVQYNLENGQYSVELVSGDMERCEQMASQLRQETSETTVLCQEEVQSNDYDRYGAVLLRVGEQYFVG